MPAAPGRLIGRQANRMGIKNPKNCRTISTRFSSKGSNTHHLLANPWHEIVLHVRLTKLITYEQSTLCHRRNPFNWLGFGVLRLQCWIRYSLIIGNCCHCDYFPVDTRR